MTLRLVLVDDHQMLREGLRRVMEDAGIEVVGEATNGADAIDVVRETKPDIVLMDVTMPGIDGIEATRRLRDVAPDSSVVMLTMHADADVFDRAIKAGAVGYLTKDAPAEDVVKAVRIAAAGDTLLSTGLAASLLTEARKEPADDILTSREEEVLQAIADGLSTQEVADTLYISLKTVKNHLASIYQKFNARDRTQAVVQGLRMGIIRLG
ncbi:MAG TPA: response regulator transcription factor [Acidimicrobiales bacterium]|jgi:DNA-binding NarL/FixJ family response regulator